MNIKSIKTNRSWTIQSYCVLLQWQYHRICHGYISVIREQLVFPSETPSCCGWLWWLPQINIHYNTKLQSSQHRGDVLHSLLTSYTLHVQCANVYARSEWHMCYTLCRGCSYAVPVETIHGDVYVFLQPSTTFYLSAAAIYAILHTLHICFASWCCHL